MNGDNFLIVCFVLLLVAIITTFVYFFGFYRRRDISGRPDISPAPKRPQSPERIEIPAQKPPAQPLPVPEPAFILRIRRQEDNSVFDIDLSHGPVTLGRLSGCTDSDYCCVASMGDVSKRHCVLKSAGNGVVMITDNGSTNHTYVNGRRIDSTTVIGIGDRFSLGQSCEFTVISVQR